MASVKKSFTNFKNFDGKINKTNNTYEFPTVTKQDTKQNTRFWKVYVRLIKTNTPDIDVIDWNLLTENVVPIEESYFIEASKISDGIKAELWTEHGILDGKITRSVPTYITVPKNIGKSNERNVFQCALIHARSLMDKQIQKGSSTTQGNLNNIKRDMYYPMLAKKYTDEESSIKFPAYIQPKLDGIRCVCFLKKPNSSYESVVLYSRTLKQFNAFDYLKKLLYPILNKFYDNDNKESLYLDGELYVHGKRLQDISGHSRRDETTNVEERNEYHIYDCFYPSNLSMKFSDRHELLVKVLDKLDEETSKYVKLTPTEKVENSDDANKFYDKYKNEKYEGAMLRNSDGDYKASLETNDSRLRSKDLLKMKPTFTDEYKVIGFTEGSRGKDKGSIIWICETPDGEQFNATPKNMTNNERKELYLDALKNFITAYKDRMITIEYQDLSTAGVPLRAKAVTFRDE